MAFESVQNYYERLFFEEIGAALRRKKLQVDEDFCEDVACVALNRLPARYVRHHVDLAFYLTVDEHRLIAESVRSAVSEAIAFVDRHRR